MAPLNKVKLSLYYILFFLFTSTLISSHQILPQKRGLLSKLLEDEQPIIKNKKTDQTIKATPSKKQNTTALIKSAINSLKNKTKVSKSNSSNSTSPPIAKTLLKKLNSTSISTPKFNKTTVKKDTTKAQLQKGLDQAQPNKGQTKKKPNPTGDDDDDLVADFRNLPMKLQESFVPDFERFTRSSQVYLNKYNKEFAKGFKPYVGKRYAPAIASAVSFGFIVIPLILVSLIFNRIKAYFSLQRLLIFIQIYLAIYFTILSLSAVATGLEPLRFFYAASKSTYVCVQVMQTLCYVLYLLLLLMYLVLVFSTDTVLETKFLGLAKTFMGFAVGLHYYITVLHRAVLGWPPKTSWKAHGLYATCFIVICLLVRVDRRKKAYLVEGGEEGKQS